MSNVQITKRRENATMWPLLICKEVSQVFWRLEVVHSLSPPDDFEPPENQTTKKWKRVFTSPPREIQAAEYEVIIPAFPGHGPGGVLKTELVKFEFVRTEDINIPVELTT